MNYTKNTQSSQSKSATNFKNLSHFSDKQLFNMARRFGKNTLAWRRKFTGILPEIYKRRIYEKNYESIFVFAKKMAGLSEKQVRRVLNLEKRFKETPTLRKILVTGEVSVNKLVRVASIATPENEEELVEKVKVLPQSAIETLVRDEKFAQKKAEVENENGLHKPKIKAKSVRAHKLKNGLELSEEVSGKLLELQEKGMDVNEMLLKMLKKREKEISEEKEEIAKEIVKTEQKKINKSRYIPAKVKRIIRKEHGTKCCIPGCQKDTVAIHHSRPFALSKTHDPHFLAPLCKDHHAIAHSINLKVCEKRREAT